MKAKWLVAGAVGLFLLVLVVRVVVEGRQELSLGKEAREAGQVELAQRHFLMAARWYLPGLDVEEEALGELMGIGERALEEGDGRRATLAFDDVRGALYGAAWMYVPGGEMLEKADAGLARSLAVWNEELRKSGSTKVEVTEELARERIARSESVSGLGVLAMGLGFLAYVGCLGVVAWRWSVEGFRKRYWLAGAGAGFAVWVVSMFLV